MRSGGLPDRERIHTPRRDRPFAQQILEEAHQQHLEVHLGIDTRLPALARVHVVVGRRRQSADLRPELTRREHLVELLIKRMRRRRREIARRDPERRRFFRSLLPEHGGLRQLGHWRTTRIAAPIYMIRYLPSIRYFDSLLGCRPSASPAIEVLSKTVVPELVHVKGGRIDFDWLEDTLAFSPADSIYSRSVN